MKTIFTLLFLLSVINPAFAGWYIISKDTNRAVACTDYQPNEDDLESRDEFAFYSDEKISISKAEYFNGGIRERILSQEEKNAKQEAEEEQAEMATIYHIMFEEAYKEARKRGYMFKKMDKHVDNIKQVDIEVEEEKVFKENLKKLVDK